MAAVLEAGVLARAMARAAAMVEARNTIPILSNVRLDAAGESLTIETTDLDMAFRQTLPLAAPAKPGMLTTVGARRLAELAGSVAPGAQISLDLADRQLVVKAGRARWVLPVLPADDFPRLVQSDMAAPIELSAKDLAEAVKRVAWSVSTEATRYYLNGILLDQEGGKVRLVSTNVNTLAAVLLPCAWPDGLDSEASHIAPRKFAAQALALCGGDGTAVLEWGQRVIRLRAGDAELVSKLIDGSFPDYRRVIPAARDDAVRLDPELAREALRRVKLVETAKTRMVKVERDAGRLILSMRGGEAGGEASEDLPADAAPGHAAGFNTEFLAGALEAVGGDSVELHHEDPGAPCLVRRVVDDGALAVIMPMRLG